MVVKTLILYFHPEHATSNTNRAVVGAAAAIDGVEVVDMYALYPAEADLDLETEVERLYGADRLILQFPIHWYAPPPLLMAWQNNVLTRMFYVHPEEEGARLAGLPMMVAATAGNTPEAYTAEGVNLFPLAELLRPLHSSAHRCEFAWAEPFLAYRANKLDEAQTSRVAEDYAARIAAWPNRIARAA